jgi:uncharacterized membrane protein
VSDLIAVTYETETKAEEVRLTLLKLQKEYLIDLEDAAIVVKKQDGSIKLNQATNLPLAGAVGGSFWGLLIGTLFLNPLLGTAVGAGVGAASGALTDIGIEDKFMKELGETLQPGHSALFVLIKSVTSDKVLEEITPYGGNILRTSLSTEDEARLQAALDGQV